MFDGADLEVDHRGAVIQKVRRTPKGLKQTLGAKQLSLNESGTLSLYVLYDKL